jgi:hypothetical protein
MVLITDWRILTPIVRYKFTDVSEAAVRAAELFATFF